MAGCGSGCPWFGDSWLLSLIEWATSDCSAFFENENERVGTFASFSLHYQNGWRMLLFGMLGSVFGEGGPWVSGTTPGMIQWNDFVYINIVGSRRRFCQILSTAPFLQKCTLFSIGVHFCSQRYFTFYVNSVHIQPTLPHSKRNMEPPTKNTPFEEENLPTPKTNMSIEHPPFTKMYFLLKNGEIFQCHV